MARSTSREPGARRRRRVAGPLVTALVVLATLTAVLLLDSLRGRNDTPPLLRR